MLGQNVSDTEMSATRYVRKKTQKQLTPEDMSAKDVKKISEAGGYFFLFCFLWTYLVADLFILRSWRTYLADNRLLARVCA